MKTVVRFVSFRTTDESCKCFSSSFHTIKRSGYSRMTCMSLIKLQIELVMHRMFMYDLIFANIKSATISYPYSNRELARQDVCHGWFHLYGLSVVTRKRSWKVQNDQFLPRVGFEPTTFRLQVRSDNHCTTYLTRWNTFKSKLHLCMHT